MANTTNKNSSYGDSSIKSLKNEDQVRLRPGVIFGTNDEAGAANGGWEIIANSIDEVREGYGKQIRIKAWLDGSLEVSDDGRGVPMDWNKAEGKYNWELVFCTLYASGKYDNSAYGQALGLNGLGATAMQYASEYFDVESVYDGKSHIMHFKKGRPVGKMEVIPSTRPAGATGTTIKFKPDPEVFIGIRNSCMSPEYYIDRLRRQAMLQAGLEFKLWHEALGEEKTIVYPDGIQGFINSSCTRPILKKSVLFEGSAEGTDDPEIDPTTYKVDMRIAFNFSRDMSNVELYHNGSFMFEGGVTMTSLQRGFVAAFDFKLHELGKLGKNDHIIFKDIEQILVCVADTNAPGNRTFFKNQTKGAINNPFIKDAFEEFICVQLSNWMRVDKAGAEAVAAEVLANKVAREESEKVSKKVIAEMSKSMTGVGNKPKKFSDCRSKNPFERELWIVEGDSATGACVQARDASFQAIMPIRGKILNCLKEDFTRIFKSEIIIDLLRIFGCGIEAEVKNADNLPKFNINKLNYGKIIIATDADTDGMQIRCLVISMIYRLCPSLLRQGKVFIALTPLFEITCAKQTYFAYTEDEKEKIMTKLHNLGYSDSKIKVQRSKGLGENDPEMMSVSTMHPATRRLLQVELNEEKDPECTAVFNALLGDDIEMRRTLVQEYFSMTDVSE